MFPTLSHAPVDQVVENQPLDPHAPPVAAPRRGDPCVCPLTSTASRPSLGDNLLVDREVEAGNAERPATISLKPARSRSNGASGDVEDAIRREGEVRSDT